MATNPALKTLTEFSPDPAEHDLNRRIVQFERNAAEKTRETDLALRNLEQRTESRAGYLELNFVKTADTTLADVPGLSFDIGLNQVWSVLYELYVTLAVAGGLRVAVNPPSGATLRVWAAICAQSGVNDLIAMGTTPGGAINVTPAAGTDAVVLVRATVVRPSAAGTVALRAAQVAASGSPTTILNHSHFTATRIA